SGEAACHCVVQRYYVPVEIIPAKPNTGSGICLKLFGFIPEPVFTFIPESCSGSSRNTVRNHRGIAFTLPRIPQEYSRNRLRCHRLSPNGVLYCSDRQHASRAELVPLDRHGHTFRFHIGGSAIEP